MGGWGTFLIFGEFGEICQCWGKHSLSGGMLDVPGERQSAVLLKAGDYIPFKDFHCIKALSEFSKKQQLCSERHQNGGPSFDAETKLYSSHLEVKTKL